MSSWRVRCSPRPPSGTASSSTSSWPRWRPTTPTSIGICWSGPTSSPRRPTSTSSAGAGRTSSSIPLGVALILAELRSDDATIAAGILHDVVEDTDATMEQVRDEFGEDVARLVEGVTKLTRIHFQSREQAQAENYRKMIVAMAEDHRVILIKLADRLHNMRTIEYLGKQKQLQKARETLEVYAPLAHRLGIHTIKWELEDLAFQTLHPRKYAEIQAMVNERRAEREKYVDGAGRVLEARAGQGRHPRRDLLAREALLLHLREDGEAREGVQRDLRPDRDARARRARRQGGRARLLRGARRHPLALEADARPLQGLRGHAQVQHVPVAAHDGDRAGGQAARDPGPHARDAPDGRARDRRPLALQGQQGQEVDRSRAGLDAAARRPGSARRPTPAS